jgi:hypothetical protein
MNLVELSGAKERNRQMKELMSLKQRVRTKILRDVYVCRNLRNINMDLT